jgi:hypothetical protein
MAQSCPILGHHEGLHTPIQYDAEAITKSVLVTTTEVSPIKIPKEPQWTVAEEGFVNLVLAYIQMYWSSV